MYTVDWLWTPVTDMYMHGGMALNNAYF